MMEHLLQGLYGVDAPE